MRKQRRINTLITIINILAVILLLSYAIIGYLGYKWEIDNSMVIPHLFELLRISVAALLGP